MSIVDNTTQHSDFQFPVVGNSHSPTRVLSNEGDVAASLTINDEADALQGANTISR